MMRGSRGGERVLRILEIATIVSTSAILAYLAVIAIQGLEFLWASQPPQPLGGVYETIRVHAYQFGWRFIYPNGTSVACLPPDQYREGARTCSLEAGKAYRLEITSTDVVHSFFVPQLGVKMDAIPGYVNVILLKVDRPGVYYIYCAELCGIGHYSMLGTIVVS